MLELINAVPRSLLLPPTKLFLLVTIGPALCWRWPLAGRIVAGGGLAALVFPVDKCRGRLPGHAAGAHDLAAARAQTRRRPGDRSARRRTPAAGAEYGRRDIPDYIALARLRYAAHLQRRTGLPILVSGGDGASGVDSAPGDRAYTKADAMDTALHEDSGVPVRWIETRSRDTRQNAAYSAVLLRPDGVRRILLVADVMHMARSRSVFEHAGLEVVDAPTMFFSVQACGSGTWVPSAEGMRRSWYAVYELLGLGRYRLRKPAVETGTS